MCLLKMEKWQGLNDNPILCDQSYNLKIALNYPLLYYDNTSEINISEREKKYKDVETKNICKWTNAIASEIFPALAW